VNNNSAAMLRQVYHVDQTLYNYCISWLTHFTAEAKKLFGEVCAKVDQQKLHQKIWQNEEGLGGYDGDVYLTELCQIEI